MTYTTRLAITMLIAAILALAGATQDEVAEVDDGESIAMNADPGVSNGSIPYCERYLPSAC